jgi:hypothetical protein
LDLTPTNSKLALVLLVKELMSQLDDVCSLMKSGHSAKISKYLFSEIANVLPELEESLREEYFNILITLVTSQNNSISRVQTSPDYVESSIAVKERFAKEIREHLLKTA